MPRLTLFLMVIAVLLIVSALPAISESGKGAGLVWVLPEPSDLEGLKPEGKPEQAESENLYDLINGGASVFLSNGFKCALLQDYRSKSGILINLEVYQMDSAQNAKKVFDIKAGKVEKKDTVGQDSSLEDYYGLYRQGAIYFTVTVSKSGEEAQKQFKLIARKVIEKISQKSSEAKK